MIRSILTTEPLPIVEALEARIAPATFFVGSPTSGGFDDLNYDESPFVNTELGLDAISGKVGGGALGVADTFYLKLGRGDTVKLFNGGGFDDFIIVKGGTVIAFFIDDPNAPAGQANEVQATELVGFAFSKGASVEVKGSIFGDVVTNLTDDGSDLDMTGLISSKQTIASLTVGANVSGGIYAGGAISNLSVSGNVQEVLTGTAANVTNKVGGVTFDFFPGVVGGEGTLAVAALAGEAGPSISKVKVDSVTFAIAAGEGGAGAKGGSLSSIQVVEDTDGVTLRAGAGGAAGGTKTGGGAGGDLTNIYISGLVDPTINSPDGIHIFAGNGGDGLTTGKGGAGGKATNVFVGFDLVGGKAVPSGIELSDGVEIRSGNGGSGKTGGNGGLMTGIRVDIETPDAVGNEIEVVAGNGGDATNAAGGKAGAGGAITKIELLNEDTQPFADLLVQAGNAGLAAGVSTGAAGGSITTVSILASEVQMFAGNGSTGKTGGAGGSVTAINFLQQDSSLLNRLELSAGAAGSGNAGSGGNGGNVNNIKVGASDLTLFQINAGTAANGGTGTGGKGGNGGNVTNIDVLDDDFGFGFEAPFNLRAGNGGDGKSGGGSGGLLDKVTLFGRNVEPTISAGNGGAALTTGAGGKGGAVTNLNIFADGELLGISVSGSITAGKGGDGLATKTNGGTGGDLRVVNLNADLNVTLLAGDGGAGGATAASGKGGSITTVAGFATGGFGILAAGDAGTGGAKAAAGGSILSGGSGKLSALRAATDLTIAGGNGANGGAGGDIKGVSFGSAADSLTPTPDGDIIVQAGNGSASTTTAGKGGSIDNLNGNPSSGVGALTRIAAGEGGGSPTSTKSGIGGSVSNVAIIGFGDDLVIGNSVLFTVEAGSGGVSPLASAGGAGGGIKEVAVIGLDPDVVLRNVAAGDGAAGTAKGGNGGTIDSVNVVGSDIGVRQGQTYGYTTMGGVFAGAGGAGTKTGLAGSVRNISAEAISVIVAGRGASPQLVEKVERITIGTLNGTDLLLFNEQDLAPLDDGEDLAYRPYNALAFATQNLVGAVLDPTGLDGNKFKWNDDGDGIYELGEVPIDGLIAAKVFVTTDPTNFVPEALFTTAGLFDYDNKI